MINGQEDRRHHVVSIGAGFGGLFAAKALRRVPVRVTLIDRTNHHLFQPLLYQVASAGGFPYVATTPLAYNQPIRAANQPTGTTPPQITITGGQLGGLLDAYNNKLIPYQNQLNAFANGLASESDRISEAGYDSTGTAGSTRSSTTPAVPPTF